MNDGKNDLNAALLILSIPPLLLFGLKMMLHYCWPIPINTHTLDINPNTIEPLPHNLNNTLTQELPVAPMQVSQAPLLPEITAPHETAPPQITATLEMVDQNPPI